MEQTSPEERVGGVLASQSLGVLATESGGQPHSSLVAIAVTDDLRHVLFCTSRETHKFRNLKANARVSLLVDTRSNRESDLSEALAVTVVGKAAEVQDADELRRMTAIYLGKNGHLAAFANSPGNALVRVDVSAYQVNTFTESWSIRIDHHDEEGAGPES
jgi:nitroimidazol reductase NimA-like FMN-containing flavoprotein (pyridoxamine 5'-phosphate oxidase superfamily)